VKIGEKYTIGSVEGEGRGSKKTSIKDYTDEHKKRSDGTAEVNAGGDGLVNSVNRGEGKAECGMEELSPEKTW